MTRLRVWFVTVATAVGIVCQLHAQTRADGSPLCWHAQPAAGCRVFVLTDFGVYADITGQHAGRFRALGEWGLMVNVTPRDALGASFFLSVSSPSPDGAWQSGPRCATGIGPVLAAPWISLLDTAAQRRTTRAPCSVCSSTVRHHWSAWRSVQRSSRRAARWGYVASATRQAGPRPCAYWPAWSSRKCQDSSCRPSAQPSAASSTR